MNRRPDLDPGGMEAVLLQAAARRWMEAGPERAPERMVDDILAALPTTGQERPRRWWRPTRRTARPLGFAVATLMLVIAGAGLTAGVGGLDGWRRALGGLLPAPCDDAPLQTVVAAMGTSRRGLLPLAPFSAPMSLAVAGDGTLLLGDWKSGELLRIPLTGPATLVAAPDTDPAAGSPGLAVVGFPSGIATDASGTIIVLDASVQRVLGIDPDGRTTVIAGTGTRGTTGDGGPAADARLAAWTIARAPDGRIYVDDASRYRVIEPDGTIRAFAGTGTPGWSGDGGPATAATLLSTGGIAVAPDGRIYLGDQSRIRVVDASGTIDTFAGNGTVGLPEEGMPARDAPLGRLGAMTLDPSGRLFLVDGDAVRMVDLEGRISTVVGSSRAGAGPDCGPALGDVLDGPSDLAFHDGVLYITDTGNARVVRVRP